MEGLRGEDAVDRAVVEWDPLGGTGECHHAGNHPLKHRSHVRERLDRNDVAVARGEDAGQLARAGAEIDDGGVGAERERVEHRRRIGRACALVLVCDVVEAELAAVLGHTKRFQ